MVLNCDVRSDLNIGEGFGTLIVGHFQCLFCADGLFLYILGVVLPFSRECSMMGWENILDGLPKQLLGRGQAIFS